MIVKYDFNCSRKSFFFIYYMGTGIVTAATNSGERAVGEVLTKLKPVFEKNLNIVFIRYCVIRRSSIIITIQIHLYMM